MESRIGQRSVSRRGFDNGGPSAVLARGVFVSSRLERAHLAPDFSLLSKQRERADDIVVVPKRNASGIRRKCLFPIIIAGRLQ